MAKLEDMIVKVRVHAIDWSWSIAVACIAAVLIAGMHYGYECGCP